MSKFSSDIRPDTSEGSVARKLLSDMYNALSDDKLPTSEGIDPSIKYSWLLLSKCISLLNRPSSVGICPSNYSPVFPISRGNANHLLLTAAYLPTSYLWSFVWVHANEIARKGVSQQYFHRQFWEFLASTTSLSLLVLLEAMWKFVGLMKWWYCYQCYYTHIQTICINWLRH